jgi:hypothetical protein
VNDTFWEGRRHLCVDRADWPGKFKVLERDEGDQSEEIHTVALTVAPNFAAHFEASTQTHKGSLCQLVGTSKHS